jgi:hypothetical protein
LAWIFVDELLWIYTNVHLHMYAAGAGEGDLAHLKIHCHRAAVETVLRKVHVFVVVVQNNAAAAAHDILVFLSFVGRMEGEELKSESANEYQNSHSKSKKLPQIVVDIGVKNIQFV